MKSRAYSYFVPLYLALSAVGAAFYVAADFGKLLTNWAGMLWFLLLGAAVMAVVIGKRYPAVPLLIAVMTAMQIPILCKWVSWNGHAVFYLFSRTFEVGLYGAVFHGVLLLSGAALALYGFLRKEPVQ